MSDTCTCLKCGNSLGNLGGKQRGFQPNDGLAFLTRGHYGTTYFDPMDGSYLEIVICDRCIEVAENSGIVYRSPSPVQERD